MHPRLRVVAAVLGAALILLAAPGSGYARGRLGGTADPNRGRLGGTADPNRGPLGGTADPNRGRLGGTADPNRGLQTRLDRLVGHHDVGIAVAVGGRIVYRHDASRGRPPASNQKLLLTMALFDALGPSHRLSTRASAARLSDGVVVGDLWIDGRGDPSLDRRRLNGLVRKLKSRGVRRVAGRVRADTSYFAHDWDAPGWQPYVQDRFMPRPAALTVQPAAPGITRAPELDIVATLTTELRAAGIAVRGHGTGTRPTGLQRLAGTRSASLRSLTAAMNRDSDNYVAEMLGKRLGAEVFGAPGTIAKGARAISRWATGHGVRVLSHDASGLSYTDRVAPMSMVRLLNAGLGEPWGKQLRRSLPGAGEGTLSGRLAGLDVRAKTGTHFNGDSALSGWVGLNKGGRATFSILSNGMPKSVEDVVVGLIARHARVPRVAPRPVTVGGPELAI